MKPTSNLLIAGADDFTAPYIYHAALERYTEKTNIWLLGTGSLAGINADLAHSPVELPAQMDIVIYADGSDSVHLNCKNSATATANLLESLASNPPGSIVYISSTDVYGCSTGEAITENATVNPSSEYGRAKLATEDTLTEWCASRGVTLTILRCADIVGTGMGGNMRQIVNRIWRGTYRHILDDNSRCSVVHATDVARAAILAAGIPGTFNLTDGIDPTRHDLAEALCSRLDRKRVYTLPLRKLKILARIGDYLPVTGYNSRRLQAQLSTLTFDSSKLRATIPGFTTTPVTEYLTTHNYDANSL